MGSHGCRRVSVLNDVTSNGGMLLLEDVELELRRALLEFRDPGTGDSEREERGNEDLSGRMVSVSEEKDGDLSTGGALSKRPFCKRRW